MTPDSPLVRAVAPSPNFGDRRGRAIDALVLHYTGMATGEAALARLLDPASEVSCHYLVWEDGRIDQLVAEATRAWHAGRSFWQGERDMNTVSIGIEIVNAGRDGGCPPYPDAQIAGVIALSRDIVARHAIPPDRILAHSDIAPDRKDDPGEWFPWARLAEAGIGHWLDPAEPDDGPALDVDETGPTIRALHADLAAFGFDAPDSDEFDARTKDLVVAFQRHYRPARIDGRADRSTCAALRALLSFRGRTTTTTATNRQLDR